MRVHSVLLIALLLISSHLCANEFTEGRDKNSVEAVQSLEAYAKYKMGQYDEAREIWIELADKNNTTAFINLANLYEHGQGVERNLPTSIAWLKKAAELGDSRGQFQLGMAYEKGLGVKKDLHEAAKWLEKAAEQNDGRAQFNLGVMFATNFGQGIMTSSQEQRKQAISWLEKAKENSTEDAQEFLNLLLTL
jgi:TPR repeat protein